VPFISDDGRYVAFWSYSDQLARHDSNQRRDILLRDTKRGRTELVSLGADGRQGNEDSFDCAISGDGRVVAFDSKASNLVPGDTNHFQDVFVRLR
jgi:Tol biopolymer transport system component